ncbi:MAG: hypothetical protein K6D02_09090, partial [Lachnospiraceae bacterium]|nr:hypothetical protein [Lachnospiraceae bacterium]
FEGLDGIESAYESAKNDFNILKDFMIKFSSDDNGIKARITGIISLENNIRNEENVLSQELNEANQKKIAFDSKYSSYIHNQAANLAEKLGKEIKEKGEANCPVCNTRLCSGAEVHFITVNETLVTEEQLESLKETWEKADKKYNEHKAAIEKSRINLDNKKSEAVSYYVGLMESLQNVEEYKTKYYNEASSVSYEKLSEKTYLNEVISTYESIWNKKKEDGKVVESKKKRYDELKTSVLPQKKKIIEDLIQNKEAKNADIQKLDSKKAALSASIDEIKKNLSFESKEAASKALSDKEKAKESFENELNTYKDNCNKVSQNLAGKQGELDKVNSDIPNHENDNDKAKSDLKNALESEQVESVDRAYEILSIVPDGEDALNWIDVNEKKENLYRNDCNNTDAKITDLEGKTEGKKYIDPMEIEAKITDVKEKLGKINETSKEVNRIYENNKKQKEIVDEAHDKIKETDKPMKYLDSLAGIAGGKSDNEGGKLSFDRFVMGFIFREILEDANVYMNDIFGGRYTLQYKSEATNDYGKAGLNIIIYDEYTGESRETVSLSGGESFLVSLSLALGLSDVVQNHSGGVKLDTLFVDEGFGTLDEQYLDNVMRVFTNIKSNNRLVGIISHVEELESNFTTKINVKSTKSGSEFEIINI